MAKEKIQIIKLPEWQDPQCFVITKHVRDEAWIYFKCWLEDGEEAEYVGVLHFFDVWLVDIQQHRNVTQYLNIPETNLKSYYYKVLNSKIISSLMIKRSENNLGWEQYDKKNYSHYIVDSHDSYVNIVACGVDFDIVKGENVKQYFDLWGEV